MRSQRVSTGGLPRMRAVAALFMLVLVGACAPVTDDDGAAVKPITNVQVMTNDAPDTPAPGAGAAAGLGTHDARSTSTATPASDPASTAPWTFSQGKAAGLTCDVSATLGIGSSGSSVKCLQSALNAAMLTGTPLATDGEFGETTANAVRAFQTDRGLVADGIAGRQTMESLGVWSSVAAQPPSPSGGAAVQPAVDLSGCHPSYTPCVPNVDYDLDCADIGFRVRVNGPDTHRFDGDHDGVGCESYG